MSEAEDGGLSSEQVERVFTALDNEIRFVRLTQKPAWLAVSLVIITSAMWLAAKLYGAFTVIDAWQLPAPHLLPEQLVFVTGMKITSRVSDGETWRLISSVFVHMDIMHLGFNMWGLWVLGGLLERLYGARRFLSLYVGTGLFASIASLYFSGPASGGASGAIYGLVGALMVLGVKHKSELPPPVVEAFTIRTIPWAVFGIGIGFWDLLPFDNAAHIGGVVSGALLALVTASRVRPKPHVLLEHGATVMAGLATLVLVASAWMWSAEAERCLASRQAYVSCYSDLFAAELAPRTEPRSAPESP
jgi:membrane associated rhomboid family serine protease